MIVFLILMIVALLVLIFVGAVVDHKEITQIRISLESVGYDVYDVEFFLKTIGASLKDFNNSPSLRKQYEVFKSGGSSDFIQQAVSEKKQSQAKSSGMATGMAVGMATGMMMNQNN